MTEQSRYFLTVDWCSENRRGVFCSKTGQPYPKDDSPHTEQEMYDILGAFTLILAPKSESLTEAELGEYRYWTSLAEYTHEFGIARREE